MIKSILALILALLVSACADKFSVSGPTGNQPLPATFAPDCQPFEIEWDIDAEIKHPTILPIAGATLVQLQERSGDPWQDYAEWDGSLSKSINMTWLPLHHSMTYQVRALVAGCWSNWKEFTTGDPNENFSGGDDLPDLFWTKPVCHENFWNGKVETFQLERPVIHLKVWFSDPNHSPTYQPRQLELLTIDDVGETHDLEDAKTEDSKEFDLAFARSSFVVRSLAGSLYKVCLSGY